MEKILEYNDFLELPKIELHCHLDGSLRVDSVVEEIRTQNIDISEDDIVNINSILKAPQDCTSLVEYLSAFDMPLKVLQSKRAIRRFVFEVFEDAYKENIVYLELRFAPILHTQKGLSMKEIISSAIEGMNNAKDRYDIEGGLILCCMKNFSEEDAISTIESGKEFLGKGVCAVDLAGPEDEAFAYKFINAMKLAKEYGYKITIHAGEAASAQNVKDSIKLLHADRIGHGVRTIESEEVYNLVKENNVLLEICPTSNLQTKTVESLEKHPLIKYFKDGLAFSINTDNRTVSDTTETKECSIVSKLVCMNVDDYKKIYYNTVGAIFASDKVKQKLLNRLNK